MCAASGASFQVVYGAGLVTSTAARALCGTRAMQAPRAGLFAALSVQAVATAALLGACDFAEFPTVTRYTHALHAVLPMLSELDHEALVERVGVPGQGKDDLEQTVFVFFLFRSSIARQLMGSPPIKVG